MQKPSPSTRDLACRLLAASRNGEDPHLADPAVVIERLGASLSRLAGAEGFASLLRRALTLAGMESQALRLVRVDPDGRLQGLEEWALAPGAEARTEATIAVTAHLLELLVTFIGEPITLRLVREAWPDLPLDDPDSKNEEDR
jgi:hypothetical protein